MTETFVNNAAHILIALVFPPVLLGVIGKTKSLFAGRVGPPLLQPYWDLIKLFQKGSVFSETTTWVFKAGPVVGLVTSLIALLLIPLGSSFAPVSFTGDLILLAYLFGLGRFFTATAALDTERGKIVMGLLRKLSREKEAAVIVVTHDVRMVEGFDRVYHIADGRIQN